MSAKKKRNVPPLLRKLRKLARDPRAFGRDFLAKRVPEPEAFVPQSTPGDDNLYVLTLCFDDSTAFVARALVSLCSGTNVVCLNILLKTQSNDDFVERCVADPFFYSIMGAKEIFSRPYLANFDAVFFAKLPPGLRLFLEREQYLEAPQRPLFISAFPGLEFSPEKGFVNRLAADLIVFNTRSDKAAFETLFPEHAESVTCVVGNPTLLFRYAQRETAEPSGESIAFLAQNISPLTLRGRLDLLRRLDRSASEIKIKARQRHGENRGHVHQEHFSHESLISLDKLALEVVHCSMDEAFHQFTGFMTCSSTGLLEAAALGREVGSVRLFSDWKMDFTHIGGLAYALRYGWSIELEDQPLRLIRAPEAFFDDFELNDDNVLFRFDELLRKATPYRRELQKESSSLPYDAVCKAYVKAGNVEKAAFLALGEALRNPADRAALERLARLSKDPALQGWPLDKFISPVIREISEYQCSATK